MFTPTHEFRGMELEFVGSTLGGSGHGWYRDATGEQFALPNHLVPMIPLKPKQGEVWKYIGEFTESSLYNLVLISGDTPASFINEEGDILQFTGEDLQKPNFVKVLNADGSPA